MNASLLPHIRAELNASLAVVTRLACDEPLALRIAGAGQALIDCFRAGGKVLLAGNGGSAADAQHIAAEFVSRLKFDRPALPAIALTADTAILTAVANDYGYAAVFSRQLHAYARPGDLFVGLSTSGRSANVLDAFATARGLGLTTNALCGAPGLANGVRCDHLLATPSDVTARIQEGHIIIAHLLCDLVERTMFSPAA